VLKFIELHTLYGTGLSLVDAHLLAALRLDGTTELWTRDQRLKAAAEQLGVVNMTE
jgi:predicted nucleic acid-binding protein